MLSDAAVKRLKPAEKPYKKADSGGLYIYVTPAGGRHWRMKYTRDGKEQRLGFGPYPDVSLAAARDKRDAAKAAIRNGLDPNDVPLSPALGAPTTTGPTFREIAEEWHKLQLPRWTKTHAGDVLGSLKVDVFPAIADKPLAAIKPPDVLAIARAVEGRSVNGQRLIRARAVVGDLFTGALDELGRYGVVSDEVQTKPTDAANWDKHRAA